ncbi:MAG: glycosyltransferase [Bacteroidota bacterium]
MNKFAPIVLFVYNRPWHTRQTLEALMRNKLAGESELYVFADGPAADASEEILEAIQETRKVVGEKSWCGKVHTVLRTSNMGLANNVIDGISQIVNEHGKVIVLEDDLITSPYFLTFCNDGLEVYNDRKEVFSVNGFQFPLETNASDVFLSPLGTSSWGWATWKDRWAHFESEPPNKELIKSDRYIQSRFNFGGYDYTNMLDNKNSWAIRWYYSVFLRNGLGLFPTRSLVFNNGFDGSGEHCEEVDFDQVLATDLIPVTEKETMDLVLNKQMLHFFSTNVGENKKGGKVQKNRFKGFIVKIIKKFRSE